MNIDTLVFSRDVLPEELSHNTRRLILLCGAAAEMSARSDRLTCPFGMFNNNVETCIKSYMTIAMNNLKHNDGWSLSCGFIMLKTVIA